MKYSKAVMLLWVVLLLASSMFNNAVSQGMCGDANDDGKLDVSDALWILNYSAGGPPPMPQVLCGDANGNGFVNLADFVYIIDYIFIGSPAPGDCSGGCDPFTGPGDGTYDFGPGIPDTIEVVSVQVDPSPTEDIVFSVPVHIVNDEDISALSLGFYYDSDDIEMDSISLTGGVASGFYNKSQVYPSQNLGIIGFHPLYAGATPISPGEGLLASMWFTLPAGVSDQTISIDSGFASPAAFFIISTSSGSPFKPYFESGATITVGVGDFELFSPAVNYDANGSDIYYITVFDADGDTDIDVATSNCGTDDISVIMNNGDGTFGTVVNYAADNCPYGVSAADLDNDDDMDLIVSNSWADNVQTFYNNGAGSFTLWHTYTVGGGADEPRISCVADFDDDGDYDLAVPFVASDDIYIGYNDGSGYISWWDSYLAGNGPNSVIATQLNSDNNLDLAVANQHDGNIAIFTNDGVFGFNGPFNFTANTDPYNLCTGYINADNFIDLIVPYYWNGNLVTILFNDGSGNFNTTVDYMVGSWPSGACAADFDNDNDVDIAVTKRGENNVSILLNDGVGNMTLDTNYSVGSEPMCIKAADLDGDNDMDLAVANYSGSISILLNQSPGADYTCGDANADGTINVSDAVYIVNFVFVGGNPPDPMESGDCNCDGSCNVSDAVVIINFVFVGGYSPCDTNGDEIPDC